MMALESSFPKTFRSKAHKNEKSTRLNMKSNAHTFAELHQTKLWRNDNDGVEDSCYRFNMECMHSVLCATVMHEFIGGSGMDGIPSET